MLPAGVGMHLRPIRLQPAACRTTSAIVVTDRQWTLSTCTGVRAKKDLCAASQSLNADTHLLRRMRMPVRVACDVANL